MYIDCSLGGVGSRSDFFMLVSYDWLAHYFFQGTHGEQGDISIRGARHDHIAPHKLNTFRAKALQVKPQRKPQHARRTRATNTLPQQQLSHHKTTMADKWRVPQRLSIDPDRVRKRRDAPTRARR